MKNPGMPCLRTAIVVLALACTTTAHAGSCTIRTSGIAFGPYQQLTFAGKLTSTEVTSTGSVEIQCLGITTGGNFTAVLGPSTTGPGDRISVRYLANQSSGGDPMAYNLFRDPTYTLIWGSGGAGSEVIGTIPLGDSSQSFTFYGRIPAGQNTLRAGSFTDTLTMTLTYNP